MKRTSFNVLLLVVCMFMIGSTAYAAYDTYDVYDYEDPEDFADDWAEDFESWDDAYDYWETKHDGSGTSSSGGGNYTYVPNNKPSSNSSAHNNGYTGTYKNERDYSYGRDANSEVDIDSAFLIITILVFASVIIYAIITKLVEMDQERMKGNKKEL